MAGLLTTSSMMMCPHGGIVQASTSNSKVKTTAGYLLRSTDTFLIAGCVLNVAGVLHPCVRVQWVTSAAQSKTLQSSNLTKDSVGLCVAADMAVQGAVLIQFTQTQVIGR
jgi:hypothetical protein